MVHQNSLTFYFQGVWRGEAKAPANWWLLQMIHVLLGRGPLCRCRAVSFRECKSRLWCFFPWHFARLFFVRTMPSLFQPLFSAPSPWLYWARVTQGRTCVVDSAVLRGEGYQYRKDMFFFARSIIIIIIILITSFTSNLIFTQRCLLARLRSCTDSLGGGKKESKLEHYKFSPSLPSINYHKLT